MIPVTSVTEEDTVNFHSDLQRPFLWKEREKLVCEASGKAGSHTKFYIHFKETGEEKIMKLDSATIHWSKRCKRPLRVSIPKPNLHHEGPGTTVAGATVSSHHQAISPVKTRQQRGLEAFLSNRINLIRNRSEILSSPNSLLLTVYSQLKAIKTPSSYLVMPLKKATNTFGHFSLVFSGPTLGLSWTEILFEMKNRLRALSTLSHRSQTYQKFCGWNWWHSTQTMTVCCPSMVFA